MVGPSGVGKSSLANALAGQALAETREIRESDGRGRHTTTARELHLLPGGGMLVDTPACGNSACTTTPRAWTPPTPTSPRWPPSADSATAGTAPSPAARSPPPSTTAGSTRPYSAWRKLQAEAHRQLLRVDARARAAERARLRSFHRAVREQPNRLR